MSQPREIQKLQKPEGKSRVETGATQFGDEDWPGLFLRGDDAMALLAALKRLEDIANKPGGTFAEKVTLTNCSYLIPIIEHDVLGEPR